MNGIDLILTTLRDGEARLADQLSGAARRHRDEHEIHYVAGDLAVWSRRHRRLLEDAVAARGIEPGSPRGDFAVDTAFAPEPDESTSADGPSHPGLELLRDLRELHLSAAENSLHWEMLAQTAQAAGHSDLLALASGCHPETLRQMRWTNTMIKTLSPQILTNV
ncbi:MAG: hypothetical protein HOU01_22660 [Streptomycetaceae bacterium]|nr:hypothetical protein [Streptomycetaceae bacterium]